jgi:hypothetical protein
VIGKTLCRTAPCAVPVLLLMLGPGLWHLGRSTAAAQPGTDEPNRSAAGPSLWCGVGSCAAAACHGGGGPRGSAGSEYTTWVRDDPHARAYSVLLDDRSRRMMRSLGVSGSAGEYALCLSCHVRNDKDLSQLPVAQRLDGVGCENCHGAAGNWLDRHYLDEWKSPEKKRELGMRDTRDLRQRAEACASCHVGSPGRDVNHDLIAAGHPRLNFEFAAYLDLMPRHWDVRDDRRRYPDLEIRAWTIGQLVSAREALRLLAGRADQARESGGKPWPEFAEYDCYACHHSLRTSNWNKEGGSAGHLTGSLPWGTWYFSLLPRAADAAPASRSDDAAGKVQVLRELMEQPRPEPGKVAAQARDRASDVDRWLDQLAPGRVGPPSLQSLAEGHSAADLNWDQATQIYCALAAYYLSWQESHDGQRDPAIEGNLRDLVALLRFPDARAGATRPNSPASYDRDQFLKRLQAFASQPGK